MSEGKIVHTILVRARIAACNGNGEIIDELIELIQDYQTSVDHLNSLLAENIREVEEVASELCGWAEGADHPEDMRVSLACAELLHSRKVEPTLAQQEVEPYTAEKRGKILVVQDGKLAMIECYDGSLNPPTGIALTGESAAQAACRGADVLAGLNVEVNRAFEPFFSIEGGAATSVFLGRCCGPSRPHPVHAMGYLRWVDLQEARARLSGVDAKALSIFFPEDKQSA